MSEIQWQYTAEEHQAELERGAELLAIHTAELERGIIVAEQAHAEHERYMNKQSDLFERKHTNAKNVLQ